jgi:putative ABC transport system ATP-binding protein
MIRDILAYKTNGPLREKEMKMDQLLELLELEQEILSNDLETLSGGEKQRIAILVALLLRRNFFLLDEPTAFLDTDLKTKMAQYFSEKKDWTVLVISHDTCWLNSTHFKTIRLGK